jgi:hypothetical protein
VAMLSGVSDDGPGHANIGDRLIAELRPILATLENQLELDDHAHDLVISALANAMLTGARVAVAAAAAQAIERGVDFDLQLDIGHGDLTDAAE